MRRPAPPPDLWQQLPPGRQQEVLHILVPLLLASLESGTSSPEGAPREPLPRDPKDKEKDS